MTFLGNVFQPFPGGMYHFLHYMSSHIYPVYSCAIAPITLAHTVCSHAYLFLCKETLLKARTTQQMMLMPCHMSPSLTLSSPAAAADSSCTYCYLLSSHVTSIYFATWELSSMPFALHGCKAAQECQRCNASGADFNQWGTEICGWMTKLCGPW